MNFKNLFLGLVLFPLIAVCQIPNPSFEDWTNSIPDGWQINSSPPSLLPVTQSADAHSGNYALRCEIVDDAGFPFGPYVEPVTSSYGFPYTQSDTVLYGFYKADMIGSNLGLIEVWVYDSLLNQVGGGSVLLPSTAVYTEFAIPIIYSPGAIAYEMSVIIQMTDTDTTGGFNIGSYFLVDDLSFTHTSTVNITSPERDNYSVSPNPANDHIMISADFNSRKSQHFDIYDLMGKKLISDRVAMVNNITEVIDVSSLQPGSYLMVITDDGHSSTKKIVISR